MARVAGVASVERLDSIACVSASMPVAAVTRGGRPSIRFGSSAIAAGTSLLSTMANFRPACGSETTEATVTSEPLPAVVGTAKNGSTLPRTLK